MKNLKFIYLTLILAVFTLVSCDNNEPLIDQENPNQSASARSAMNELQTHFNENGQLRSDNNPTNNILFDYCFDFQFPMTFSYNTGTTITVNDFNALIEVLVQMTDVLYIDGVVFPFNVEVFDDATGSIVVQTITSESDFETLLDSCDFDNDDCVCTADYDPICIEVQGVNGGDSFTVEYPNFCEAACDGFTQADIVDCDYSNPGNGDVDCFEYDFPISLIGADGVTVTATNLNEFENILYASNGFYDFVYPFDVSLENEGTRTINNAQELEDLIVACIGVDPCNCPTVFDPVCVLITSPNGFQVQDYPNMCLAECDGFTQADVVDCNSSNDCIDDIVVTIGDCIDTTSYTVTFNFTSENYVGDFQLFVRNNVLLTTGNMSDLPLTLTMPLSGYDEDYIKIVLENNCEEEQEWYAPDCGTDSCWDFVYPVTFSTGGGNSETVNSDNDATVIFTNNQQAEPVLPFNVTIDGQTQVITTAAEYEAIGYMDNWCRI